MKVRAHFALVFNLDKCIGCHTCSVTCKNVWTNRKGVEYAWFNNVESKPGVGYPKDWENQETWRGGWELKNGKLQLKSGSRLERLLNIFANPDLPEIDDYYEPFTYDYQHLQTAPESEHVPVATPVSLLTGDRMDKIEWGPNWEEILGGEFAKRSKDVNFEGVQKDIYGQFENTFMMYLPRLCEHCLNPTCVASCPSGSIYKREEDGIVLVDYDKCIGCKYCSWACPYGAREIDEKQRVMKKCTLCVDRIYDQTLPEAERKPACVLACPTNARLFGDIHDPESHVSVLIREEGGYPLMPEWGSKPANHYLPRRKTRLRIHEDELLRADNPLKKEGERPAGPVSGPTLDDVTSW